MPNRYDNHNNRRNEQERRMNDGDFGRFNYRPYNRNERYGENNMGYHSDGRIRNYNEGKGGYGMNRNNMKEKGKWEDRTGIRVDEKDMQRREEIGIGIRKTDS